MDAPLRIDEQIMNSDRVICRHIDSIEKSTIGEISQDILSHLRHFVEHIMLKIYANGEDIEDSHENVQKAVKYVKSQMKLKHIARFHRFLQVSVSHRTLAEENANRLMLKYYEYLLRIKNYLQDNYSMEVLHNLEKFPIEIDDSYKEYYEKISEKIELYHTPIREGFRFDRFYIQSIKPFFVNGKVYYEVAFIPANDKASKTDRIIAFTDIELSDYYAVRFAIANISIEIFGKTMPIRVIVNWEVNIRPCEFDNFAKLIYKNAPKLSKAEQKHLSQYLTDTGANLSELLDISDEVFANLRSKIVPNSSSTFFFDILDYCRELAKNHRPGANILKYLLFHMTNRIIKAQYKKHWNERNREYTGNFRLSGLYLHYKCIPFDQMPFCSSLRKHVPSISDIFDCFDVAGREHEVLAWHIRHNTEQKGILFTPLEKAEGSDSHKYKYFDDVETLVRIYNSKLYDNDTATAFQAILAQIGIKAEVNVMDSSALAAIQKEDDIDGFIANRGASKMDFTNNYIRLYSSEGIKNHGIMLRPAEFEEPLFAARAAKTIEEKKANLQKAAKALVQDYVMITPMAVVYYETFAVPGLEDSGIYDVSLEQWTPEAVHWTK